MGVFNNRHSKTSKRGVLESFSGFLNRIQSQGVLKTKATVIITFAVIVRDLY